VGPTHFRCAHAENASGLARGRAIEWAKRGLLDPVDEIRAVRPG
jgi:hypothetical protein